MIETSGVVDALHAALERARGMTDQSGLVGFGVAHLVDGDRKTKLILPFHNLITDAGDLYIAGKTIAGIAPASAAAPTAATGMKLGTGTSTPTKAGAGAALITYLAGSNVAFAATFPQTSNLGSGLGVTALYRSTWAPGVATNAAIGEVVLVNDSATNATSVAANTYSRALFGSTINKAVGDTLTVDWNWKSNGA